MDIPTAFPEAVAAELRAEMGRQQRSVPELAEALGLKDRKSARARYDGSKSLTIAEVVDVAAWLGIEREQLLAARVAVAS